MNDNEIIEKIRKELKSDINNCENKDCSESYPCNKCQKDIAYLEGIKAGIKFARQEERQNMIKMIDDIIEEIHTTGDFKLKNRIQILEELKSQLQSPDVPASFISTTGRNASAEPSGLQTHSQETNDEQNVVDTRATIQVSGDVKLSPDTQTLSDKVNFHVDEDIMYHEKDIKKAIRKLKDEIKRGVDRNQVFPLDWCMNSIDEIFGERLVEE